MADRIGTISLDALEADLEAMANQCSVDMALWDRFSNGVLALIAAARAKSEEPSFAEVKAAYEATGNGQRFEPWAAEWFRKRAVLEGDHEVGAGLAKSPDPAAVCAQCNEPVWKRIKACPLGIDPAVASAEIAGRCAAKSPDPRPLGEEVAGLVADIQELIRLKLGEQSVCTEPCCLVPINVLIRAAKALSTLSAERDAVEGALKPTMFWDAEDSENGGCDPDDVVSNYAPGEVVRLETGVRLADVFGVAVPKGDTFETLVFATAEECEAAHQAALQHKGETDGQG